MTCVTHHLLRCCLQVLLLLSTGFSRVHPNLKAQAAVELLGLCLVRAPYAAINHAAQAAAKLHALPELLAGQQAAVLALRLPTGHCRPFSSLLREAYSHLGVLLPASSAVAAHPVGGDVA